MTPSAPSEPQRRNGALVIAILALILGASGALVWFLMNRTTEPPASMVGPGARATADPTQTALAQLPEDLRARPDQVDEAVKAAAAKLAEGPEAALAAVKAAIEAGHLPPLHEMEEPLGAPRAAGHLAMALAGQQAPPTGPLEVTSLARALLKARGVEARVGVDEAAPRAATDLRRRRYVLKVGGGPWRAVDGGPVDEARVRPLDEIGWMGQVLAWRTLGAMALRDGDQASRAIGQARQLDGQDAALELLQGQVQLANGLTEMGLATMEAAAARKGDGMSWFTVGIAAMQAQQSFKAHQHLAKATELDPGLGEAWVMLAQLALERAGLTPKEEVPKLIETAEAHLAAADKADPKAPGLRTMRARIAVIQDRHQDAETLLREEAQVHPEEEASWLVLAGFLTELGRGEEALDALQEGAGKVRGGAEIHRALGTALFRQGRAADALAALERALAGDPGSADLRPAMAQLEKTLGRPAKARELLKSHLDRFGEDGQARLLAAQLELDEGQDAAAEAHLSAVLKAEPANVDALMLRYLADVARKRDATAAREAVVKAVGLRSTVAQVLLENGLVEEGEGLLREAMAKDPQDAMAAPMMIAVLAMTARTDEATKLKDEIVAKAPEAARAELAAQLEGAIRDGAAAAAAQGSETGVAP